MKYKHIQLFVILLLNISFGNNISDLDFLSDSRYKILFTIKVSYAFRKGVCLTPQIGLYHFVKDNYKAGHFFDVLSGISLILGKKAFEANTFIVGGIGIINHGAIFSSIQIGPAYNVVKYHNIVNEKSKKRCFATMISLSGGWLYICPNFDLLLEMRKNKISKTSLLGMSLNIPY